MLSVDGHSEDAVIRIKVGGLTRGDYRRICQVGNAVFANPSPHDFLEPDARLDPVVEKRGYPRVDPLIQLTLPIGVPWSRLDLRVPAQPNKPIAPTWGGEVFASELGQG